MTKLNEKKFIAKIKINLLQKLQLANEITDKQDRDEEVARIRRALDLADNDFTVKPGALSAIDLFTKC